MLRPNQVVVNDPSAPKEGCESITYAATPPIFMALRSLRAAGRDLREEVLRVRRERLEDMLDGQDVLLPARHLADDGLMAWAQWSSAATGAWSPRTRRRLRRR